MEYCAACPRINCPIAPSGPTPCDILFVGEAPGKDENKRGQVFIGKTGREFNEHYLPIASLHRENVRVANAICCLPPGTGGKLDINKQADMDMLLSCASTHLMQEIQDTQPKVIVPMGVFACRAIDPDINLEFQHGIPLETAFGTVFPQFHPAGGLHEPKKMLMIRNDFVRLGKYLKGKLHIPRDEHNSPDYREISADEIFDEYLKCNDYTFPIAIDTEIKRDRTPFCLTFSTAPGTGYLIRAESTDALEIFQQVLLMGRGPILLHNYYFDGPVLEAMGIQLPFERVLDTMVRAYHLGNLPQGLKALAYRLLGMTMMDFDDLVTPYALPLCLEYIHDAYMLDWPKPDEQTKRDETGNWKLYKPQSMGTKFKRFLTDFAKHPDKDVLESWANWEESHKLVEERVGRPWPGKCVSYAPFEKVIHYACRDADATLRLWPILEHMRRMVRRKPQEHWALEVA